MNGTSAHTSKADFQQQLHMYQQELLLLLEHCCCQNSVMQQAWTELLQPTCLRKHMYHMYQQLLLLLLLLKHCCCQNSVMQPAWAESCRATAAHLLAQARPPAAPHAAAAEALLLSRYYVMQQCNECDAACLGCRVLQPTCLRKHAH
jgi:hypothetical protein